LSADNPIWRLVGKKCDYNEWEVESGTPFFALRLSLSPFHLLYRVVGQILINKSGNDGLNLAALHVTMHMQLEHEFYFSLSGGDKDTFVSPRSFMVGE